MIIFVSLFLFGFLITNLVLYHFIIHNHIRSILIYTESETTQQKRTAETASDKVCILLSFFFQESLGLY